jgi:hypothetical protein
LRRRSKSGSREFFSLQSTAVTWSTGFPTKRRSCPVEWTVFVESLRLSRILVCLANARRTATMVISAPCANCVAPYKRPDGFSET